MKHFSTFAILCHIFFSAYGANNTDHKINCQLENVTLSLGKFFGFNQFRGKQKEVVEAVLAGNDVFAIMPTGAGKSLCYQLPAVLSQDKVAIVVTPLIALMLGQVESLKKKGISAAAIFSDQGKKYREMIINSLNGRNHSFEPVSAPTLRLLYVSPELLLTSGFETELVKLYNRGAISLFAIDEAHCVSEFGHEFRPSFRKLGTVHSRFPLVPWLALTATATRRVIVDVVQTLQLKANIQTSENIFMQSFDRPNICYQVRHKEVIGSDADVAKDMIRFISSQPPGCAGIVYCRTKAACEEVASGLASSGISSRPYHGGMKRTDRATTQADWMCGQVRVVAATIAFGMGIDKADVRFVVHHSLPKSLEAYYQETGRAGRDGLHSQALLYYSQQDLRRYVLA